MQRFEFPLKRVRTERGIVPEPIIPVEVQTIWGFRTYDFLVDSGADLSLLPFSMLGLLGLRESDCKTSVTYGIEGRGVKTFQSRIKIRLGEDVVTLRCSISAKDDVPFILGRLDLFYLFTIIFDNEVHEVILERIR